MTLKQILLIKCGTHCLKEIVQCLHSRYQTNRQTGRSKEKQLTIRKHSSRMRTARLLTAGGCESRGVQRVCVQGVCVQGVCVQGVCVQMGCVWSLEVYTPGPRNRHHPLNRMTDRCKNITIPQLRLRSVTNFDYLMQLK